MKPKNLMEGEFQDKGKLDQELEEWLFTIGFNLIAISSLRRKKKESIHIEGSAPYGAILINQSSEGETSTMLVVKWSDNVEVLVDNIDNTLWGGLYKGDDDSLVTW